VGTMSELLPKGALRKCFENEDAPAATAEMQRMLPTPRQEIDLLPSGAS